MNETNTIGPGREFQESPYAVGFRLIKSMAAARYGREITEHLATPQPEASNEMRWRFRCTASGSLSDDPLYWRLDTYEMGVNAHTVFQLHDVVDEELIKDRFLNMDYSRKEYYESNQITKGKAYYLGSQVVSEALEIRRCNKGIFFGPSIPVMPDEDGEKIVGMYARDKDTYEGAWNLDGCPLVDI